MPGATGSLLAIPNATATLLELRTESLKVKSAGLSMSTSWTVLSPWASPEGPETAEMLVGVGVMILVLTVFVIISPTERVSPRQSSHNSRR